MKHVFSWQGPSATTPLNVRVPVEYRDALLVIAASMGGSISWMLREAIQHYVESHPLVTAEQSAELRRIHAQIRSHRISPERLAAYRESTIAGKE